MRSVPFIPVKGFVFCLVLAMLTSCGTSTSMVYVSVLTPPASDVNIGNAQDLCIVAPYYKDRDSTNNRIYTSNLLHELKHQLLKTPNLQSALIDLRMIGMQNEEPDDSLINELYKECPSEAFIFIDVISKNLEFVTIPGYLNGNDADVFATGKYC
ncbi:MAG: hypothetical protein LBH34_04090 [Prevotellaceae bacterium]|jgi:hypothetical protein|nr:hypothetical protein [Prevotellaceae bacterium]